MINLLPQQQKEEIITEEKFKLVLIFGIVILAFLISLSLILFSIKNIIFGQLEIQKIFLKEKELKVQKIQEMENKIKDYNLILSNLDSFYQKNLNLTEILEKLSKILPQGTYLTNFNFNLSTLQISLSGFCPDRETLLSFKENLEKEEKFEKVYFPPSNWLEPTDINFSLIFKIKTDDSEK